MYQVPQGMPGAGPVYREIARGVGIDAREYEAIKRVSAYVYLIYFFPFFPFFGASLVSSAFGFSCLGCFFFCCLTLSLSTSLV